MNSEEIKELIKQIDSSTLQYFELSKEEFSIKMSKREVETEYVSTKDSTNQTVSQPQVQRTDMNENQSQTKKTESVSSKSEDKNANYHMIKAPIVGTNYLSSSPEASPFIQVGDKVTKGQTLVIIEAMKVMNEIKSDVDGIVKEILVEDGQAVEYDQPLIAIDSE
ncbi:acetyl-CoA carboxylase biotin carboxyl carrier protein [Alkalibacterium iburiense]|uniref:Biotin carboxyl carrier protein of acetyl-CoA carboxylase n=1 Tax=Alkalibacterium iburiense TaxID=290589 RepID=A0ABN0X8E7_9LACT